MVTFAVCLLTALGFMCNDNATLPDYGDCIWQLTRWVCMAEVDEIPIWASTYDYAICAESPINCDSDPTVTANGTPTSPDLYWNTAACPHGWVGKTVVTDFGSVLCNDRGGAINLTYRRVWVHLTEGGWEVMGMWVWIVDYMMPIDEQPYWAYQAHSWEFE
jgi:hypothetical protein